MYAADASIIRITYTGRQNRMDRLARSRQGGILISWWHALCLEVG